MKHSLLGFAALVATSVAAPALAVPIASMDGQGMAIRATGGEVTATYQGSTASYRNRLFLNGERFVFDNNEARIGDTVSLGSFDAGTELLFSLFVTNTGNDFFSGAAERNADGAAHARVEDDWMEQGTLVSFEDLYNGAFDYNDLSFSLTNASADVAPVPVPAAAPLLAGAIGGIFALRRRRFKQA